MFWENFLGTHIGWTLSFSLRMRFWSPTNTFNQFENFIHNIFRNEKSTLEINVTHFLVLHWQQWQSSRSTPVTNVVIRVSFYWNHNCQSPCLKIIWRVCNICNIFLVIFSLVSLHFNVDWMVSCQWVCAKMLSTSENLFVQ